MEKVDLREIKKIITPAFQLTEFNQFYAAFYGNKRADDFVVEGGDAGLGDIVYNMLERANSNGILGNLLFSIAKEKPNVPAIQELAAKYYGSLGPIELQRVEHKPKSDSDNKLLSAKSADFERVIRHDLNFVDANKWLELYQLMMGRVCRIDINGRHAGSGFLVGPSAVLTCFHVLKNDKVNVIDGDTPATAVRCVFDPNLESNVAVGKVIELNQSSGSKNDWLLAYAKASGDEKSDSRPPSDADLDFALIKLARPIGHELANHGKQRGWIQIKNVKAIAAPPPVVMILQYPNILPVALRLAFDSAPDCTSNPKPPRLLYKTNTLDGSSGSPVFDGGWNILALHHFGGTSWAAKSLKKNEHNQGVPIHSILQALSQESSTSLDGN